MDNPLVSVNMTTYNHESYIAEAIKGVVSQETDFPFELVIGEDYSTDRTLEIVLDYQRKYPDIISVITSEKNVGYNNNFKRVLAECKGKYLAYCEGDDYWHNPKKLQMQVDYLEMHPDCGLVHSDVDRHVGETNKTIPSFHKDKRPVYKHKNILNSMIAKEYIVETCTAVIRKGMFDEIRESCLYEFSEFFLMGDVQTWMEIAYRSEVKYIDESLATRNVLPDSMSNAKDIEKRIRFAISSRGLALHYAKKYGGQNAVELIKHILTHYNSSMIRAACHASKHKLAQEILEDSKKYDVALGSIDYLYIFCTQKNIVSFVVRAFLLFLWRCRQSLTRVRWLRKLRDSFRG